MREIAITGAGLILPNCDSRETFWQQLRDGESQISLCPDPSAPTELVPMGRVHDFDARRYLDDTPERFYNRFSRAQLLYLASLFQACKDAGIDRSAVAGDRVGLFDGTSRDHLDVWCKHLGEGVPLTRRDVGVANAAMGVGLAAAILGVRGPTYTYSSTCSSGVVAVGHALRELEHGDIDLALAGGHDAALLPPVFQAYGDAALFSREREDGRRAIRPYGGDSGNAFGEAAVTVALESRDHAEARGAEALATLVGYRYGNSGLHPTNIEETGGRAAELIESLLAQHGVAPDEVGFVVGHGNGVEGSDRSELAYMRRVFGTRAPKVPLVTVKPIYGHTLGASGVVSLAAAALMLKNQFVVPTINMDPLRDTGVPHQPNVGEPRRCETGLVVCFGIGGQNAVVLLRRAT